MNLEDLIRPNIKRMKPYSSARSEYQGKAEVWLDANENPYERKLESLSLNRYPNPKAHALRQAVAEWKGVSAEQVFLGNGSDEIIDLLFRLFCVPGQSQTILCQPTYGMYAVSAALNDVATASILLGEDGQPKLEEVLQVEDENTPLLWLCSPNNPTGISIEEDRIRAILGSFSGIVVVDEAYIDFSDKESCIKLLGDYPNLVVMQTFSKARGLAGIRVGMAFASAELITWLDRIKPPYNLNSISQQIALEAIRESGNQAQEILKIRLERKRLRGALETLPGIKQILQSDANFLLLELDNPGGLRNYLLQQGIVTRDRSGLPHGDFLRITVGTENENDLLIRACAEYFAGSKLEKSMS
ncbi:MAG: histidinol-phosphate transaminase [Bacteroidetes bacterium]|nr:histidinol-phosphate transaminase [Bacteroidota bacterium]